MLKYVGDEREYNLCCDNLSEHYVCPIRGIAIFLSYIADKTKPGPGEEGYAWECIGSDCMFWRYSGHVNEDGDLMGYCGLAGDPFAEREYLIP